MTDDVRLTSKEAMYLDDAFSLENLFLAKCNVYADQIQDNELKSLLFSFVKNCRQHASAIKTLQSENVLH